MRWLVFQQLIQLIGRVSLYVYLLVTLGHMQEASQPTQAVSNGY